ncbi:RimK family protein [Catenovulum sediminis]|uniref:RimK family protein n=1 Tax=Catenovulum sediminis TaxID=1740262 RepID=A0ABV1RKU1_9ALTE|nr:RimK family protein [Catenovulum sediminis]
MFTSFVVSDEYLSLEGKDVKDNFLLTFDQYLAEHPRKDLRKVKIINLCDTDQYLSKGYYCSLLAEARGHKVLPSVNTINDLRNEQLYKPQLSDTVMPAVLQKLRKHEQRSLTLYIYFGQADISGFEALAKKLFMQFPAPILSVEIDIINCCITDINCRSYTGLNESQFQKFEKALLDFNQRLWLTSRPKKRYRWDMAILVDENEALPPSDKVALAKMVKAAAKVGIRAEFIGENDYAKLNEFDALFIRVTTAIDHYTYRFARKAELEGLVVIDDPTSILRCCNKVFLQDAFSYNKVPALKTISVSNASQVQLDKIESEFTYPMVLKVPESAFSKGVFKVQNRDELHGRLSELLNQSALVLIQTYLFTEFDWRIGVLNNKPLYACKYHMARNHWQIYKHDESTVDSGGFDTLPTFEVPKVVLDAALKAAKVIGSGLYGVDIKQHNNQAYVIEINDNPSLDSEVEDLYLGDELYMIIMSEMARRLEQRGR